MRYHTGSPIGYVAVYNRDDGDPYVSWLTPYELWLGSSPGDLHYQCGGGPLTANSERGLGPFVTSCGGRSDLPYVTVLLRSGTQRWLTVGEIEAYHM